MTDYIAHSYSSIQRTRQLLETKDAEIHRLSAKIRRMEHSVVVEDSPVSLEPWVSLICSIENHQSTVLRKTRMRTR